MDLLALLFGSAFPTLALILLVVAGVAALLYGSYQLGRNRHVKPTPAPVPPLRQSLPVTSDATPKRRCEGCKHFDPEEGQALLQHNRIFWAAAQVMPPAEMGRHNIRRNVRKCPDCEAGYVRTGRYHKRPEPTAEAKELERRHGHVGFVAQPQEVIEQCTTCHGLGELSDDELSAPAAPYRTKWEDFGACLNPAPEVENMIRWKEDGCPAWEPKS